MQYKLNAGTLTYISTRQPVVSLRKISQYLAGETIHRVAADNRLLVTDAKLFTIHLKSYRATD